MWLKHKFLKFSHVPDYLRRETDRRHYGGDYLKRCPTCDTYIVGAAVECPIRATEKSK